VLVAIITVARQLQCLHHYQLFNSQMLVLHFTVNVSSTSETLDHQTATCTRGHTAKLVKTHMPISFETTFLLWTCYRPLEQLRTVCDRLCYC